MAFKLNNVLKHVALSFRRALMDEDTYLSNAFDPKTHGRAAEGHKIGDYECSSEDLGAVCDRLACGIDGFSFRGEQKVLMADETVSPGSISESADCSEEHPGYFKTCLERSLNKGGKFL